MPDSIILEIDSTSSIVSRSFSTLNLRKSRNSISICLLINNYCLNGSFYPTIGNPLPTSAKLSKPSINKLQDDFETQ